jgi:hypothetical protein
MIDTRDLDAPPAADSDAEINGLADQPIALLRPDGVPPDALAELVLRLQKQLAQHRREWRRHAAVSTADREQLRGMLVRHLAEPPAVPERLGRRINALVIIVSGLVLLSWTDAVGTLERLGIPANASIAIAALAWAGYEIFGWRWPPPKPPANGGRDSGRGGRRRRRRGRLRRRGRQRLGRAEGDGGDDFGARRAASRWTARSRSAG